MAVTQGHGNPKWTRDETLLALDLYFTLKGQVPSSKAPEIVALSNLLRSLPYHLEAAKQPTFRNPAGVGFKLMNLRQVATGKGLGNVSAMDRHISKEFWEREDEVHKLAAAIGVGILPCRDIAITARRRTTFRRGVKIASGPAIRFMELPGVKDWPPDSCGHWPGILCPTAPGGYGRKVCKGAIARPVAGGSDEYKEASAVDPTEEHQDTWGRRHAPLPST